MNQSTCTFTLAGYLLDAGCVSVKTDEPFRLPSGWASPVYMDCRRLISFPDIRRHMIDTARVLLGQAGALDRIQGIVGAESSGIAFAAWLADALTLPLQFVRKRAIGHAQVEGVLHAGERLLLVDDLMAAGLSKALFHEVLTAKGAIVEDLFVIFDYGTFDAVEQLKRRGVRVHALCTWRDILTVARTRSAFAPKALDELAAFIDAPGKWSSHYGGIQTSSWSS